VGDRVEDDALSSSPTTLVGIALSSLVGDGARYGVASSLGDAVGVNVGDAVGDGAVGNLQVTIGEKGRDIRDEKDGHRKEFS
jgi:hypothetical protein